MYKQSLNDDSKKRKGLPEPEPEDGQEDGDAPAAASSSAPSSKRAKADGDWSKLFTSTGAPYFFNKKTGEASEFFASFWPSCAWCAWVLLVETKCGVASLFPIPTCYFR